jgi:hypothetical protein
MKPNISYDGRSIVTASVRGVHGDDFDRALYECASALAFFCRSQPGSTWGSDGVGYVAQERIGVAVVHKSGVGPRKYQQGLAACAAYERSIVAEIAGGA